MKKKFILKNNLMYYHEEFIQYLENMSQKGWQLKTLTPHFMTFVACQQPYKYQIDYTDRHEEYNEILLEEGYEHVACHDKIHVYINKNLQAMDLQTDHDVHQTFLMNLHSKSSMICIIIIGIIVILLGIVGCHHFINQPTALIYLEARLLCISILGILLGMLCLYDGYITYLKRKSIMNMNYSYHHFHIYDLITQICLVILFLLSLLACLICQMSILGVILLFVVMRIYYYIINSVIPRLETKTKRNVYIWLACILCFFGQFFIRYSFEISDNIQAPIAKDFPAYELVYASYKNMFVYEIETAIPDTYVLHEQSYYRCLNETIAEDLFRYAIIEGEKLTRLPSSEKEVDQLSYETGEWSIDDIHSISYDQAISLYQRYSSKYFEDCYVLDNVVVAKHQNIVVKLIINDHGNIDKTLKQYLEWS